MTRHQGAYILGRFGRVCTHMFGVIAMDDDVLGSYSLLRRSSSPLFNISIHVNATVIVA